MYIDGRYITSFTLRGINTVSISFRPLQQSSILLHHRYFHQYQRNLPPRVLYDPVRRFKIRKVLTLGGGFGDRVVRLVGRTREDRVLVRGGRSHVHTRRRTTCGSFPRDSGRVSLSTRTKAIDEEVHTDEVRI